MDMSFERFWRVAVAPILAMAIVVVVAQRVEGQAKPSPVMTKLSEHVYVIPQDGPGARSNVGLIIGSKASLIVDSGLGPSDGKQILTQLATVRANATVYLTSTHFHPEHILGQSGFPTSATVIRSRAMQQEVTERGAELFSLFLKRPGNPELMDGASYRPADLTYDGDMVLNLGGVRVQILSLGPAHTSGDTGFFVEGDRILFTGDVAMSTPLGINPEGRGASARTSIRSWLANLERLALLRPVRVIPSHGPMGDAAMVTTHRDFLRALDERVRDLKREGKTSAEVAQVLTPELEAKFPGEVATNATGTRTSAIVNAVPLLYAELP